MTDDAPASDFDTHPPALFRALAREAREAPFARKILVTRARGAGRELLRSLARGLPRGSAGDPAPGWTGFEVTTVKPLALRIATPALADEGLAVLDDFEEQAAVDDALDEVVGAGHPFADLAEGMGFRRAVREAVQALRLAGVGPGAVRDATFEDPRKQTVLGKVLEAFEREMSATGRTDTAGVLGRATAALQSGAPLPDIFGEDGAGATGGPGTDGVPEGSRILLLPGLSQRGETGRFVRALLQRGARLLPTDPVYGIGAPEATLWMESEAGSRWSWLHAEGPGREPPAAEPPSGSEFRSEETTGLPLFDQASEAEAAPDAEWSTPPPDFADEPWPDDLPEMHLPLSELLDPDGTVPEVPTDLPSLDLELFRAGGITEELKEVVRRTLAAGRRWDEVEIVTPDPGVYGPALHSLTERMGIAVTFAVGLPVERTRPGRAVAAYLRWIEEDFPAAEVRRLLEAGDLSAPEPWADLNPVDLARALRQLRLGWGRERYETLLEAALRRLRRRTPTANKRESLEEAEARLAEEIRAYEALRALVGGILEATPSVPAAVERDPDPVAPAAVAWGLAAFLERGPGGGAVDRTARERLLRILDRIQATLDRPTAFRAAVALVREHLAIRVPAPRAEGKAPWLSDGGALHLTDLEHGGLTGRPLTFLVGFDAGRFPGVGGTDPILLDPERAALARSELPTSADRMAERIFQLAALLARLRGRVVMSYPAWEAAEGRVLAPSPVLLQAYRLKLRAGTGEANRPAGSAAGYGELLASLGPPVSRLPGERPPADEEDVWLGALSAGNHLLDGTAVVRASYPALDRGLAAAEAWTSTEAGAAHGVIPADPKRDPRSNSELVVSASRLEALGTCPLLYFYRYVLGVRSPDEPDFDLERWLDALHRGSLLHRVFERSVREALDPIAPGFTEMALEVLEREARREREELPPPSETVYQTEMTALRGDVRSFAEALRESLTAPDGGEVTATEFGFGFGAREGEGSDPVEVGTLSGTIRVRGAVDRIDRTAGGLRIVDYKTGSFRGHDADSGTFAEGRRLQHLVYALAVEKLTGDEVATAEYHYPTQRGQNEVARYDRARLLGGFTPGPALLDALLDIPAAGRFIPTNEPGDCRFCDFAEVCRVRKGDREPDSPPADWTVDRMGSGDPVTKELGAVRKWEE